MKEVKCATCILEEEPPSPPIDLPLESAVISSPETRHRHRQAQGEAQGDQS